MAASHTDSCALWPGRQNDDGIKQETHAASGWSTLRVRLACCILACCTRLCSRCREHRGDFVLCTCRLLFMHLNLRGLWTNASCMINLSLPFGQPECNALVAAVEAFLEAHVELLNP